MSAKCMQSATFHSGPHMLSVPACIAYTRPYNKNVMRIMGTPAPRPESFHTIFGIENNALKQHSVTIKCNQCKPL